MSEAASLSRTPAKVTVDLGQRSYDILIGRGVIDLAGVEIARRLPGARIAIVTDENVAGYHLRHLTGRLDAAGIRYATVTIAPGEASVASTGPVAGLVHHRVLSFKDADRHHPADGAPG